MIFDDEIKTDADHSVLCWLATVDATGTPNVTPKEIFALHGQDRFVIADIASSNSVRNILHHPPVCVSFVDIFQQRGFKLVGTGTIIQPSDEDFSSSGAELLRMAGAAFPVRNIISIQVEKASRIWAPSYRLLPDQTDEQRVKQAYRGYGVEPVERSRAKETDMDSTGSARNYQSRDQL